MKIVFMGTPEFAIPSLDMLISEGYDVAAVVTQPDKPKGRGNRLAAPPVKEYAVRKGIAVLQPSKVKTPEFIDAIRGIGPDILITAAYGKILPPEVLCIPPLGCINVHGSLLPKYRGAAPIQWAVINGEKVTGITTMFTDVGMDTGDMLLKAETDIPDDMTYGELYKKLSVMGADVLKKTLKKLADGSLVRVPQNDADATYAPIIKKDIGLIKWDASAVQIHNLVRGTDPWPGAYTFYKGKRMRIWKTQIVQEQTDLLSANGQTPSPIPGTICKVDNDGLTVACRNGCVKILEVQPDSGRRMTAGEYIRGHRIDEGETLG